MYKDFLLKYSHHFMGPKYLDGIKHSRYTIFDVDY